MTEFSISHIIQIARYGTNDQWDHAVEYIKAYQGEEDDMNGLRLFMEKHGFDRGELLEFREEINKVRPANLKKNTGKRLPNWVMVAAASVTLISGFLINHYVQQESLHVIEPPLPVYLSDEEQVMNKAMSLYKKEDYMAAAAAFSRLRSDTACYYGAVSFEMLEDFDKSIALLKSISGDSEYYVRARIRMAAIYTEQKYTLAARQILDELTPNNEDEAERIHSIKLRLN